MLRRISENLGGQTVACVGASGNVYCEPSSSVKMIAGDPIVYYVEDRRLWSDYRFGTVSEEEYDIKLHEAAEAALESIRQYWALREHTD